MAKKQKHPNLPNGFGSIRRLSGNRTNPYAVHPPVTEYTDLGKPITPKALCYVNDWYVGFAVLTAYKAGTYKPGMEKELAVMRAMDGTDMNSFTQRILADLNRMKPAPDEHEKTFAELYEEFYKWKFEGKKEYSDSSKYSSAASFKNCNAVHNKALSKIKYEDLQRIVDASTLKHSSLELIVTLCKQMFRYALAQGYIDRNPTELLRINVADDDIHGVPFSQKDLERLWDHREDDIAQILLILCFSGYRIGELKVITTNLKSRSFQGGLKTRTSKERVVPIHSLILPIVEERIEKYQCLMPYSYATFQRYLPDYLSSINVGEHTSHDCRHTFSTLCEKYGVRENDRKRMLGHKFEDITNGVYGHRSLEDLRKEIEKICLKRVANKVQKIS
ncbi:integrase [Faecalicatena sp. Marseille-Q4148]|nr:integrase [Faecalicatena sp. Marseille-Q4148]